MEGEVTFGFVILSLVVRYLGVIGVLALLMVGLIVTGAVFRRLERRKGERQKRAKPEPTGEETWMESIPSAEVDTEAVAAIAIALELDAKPVTAAPSVTGLARGPSAWAVSGRIRQLQSKLPR